MKRPSAILINTSLVLTFIVFATNVAFPYVPEASFWASRISPHPNPLPQGERELNLLPLPLGEGGGEGKLIIPNQFGTIRKITSGQSDQTIIHIQDVHHNAEAQKNIAGVVQTLIDSDKVDLIALEGAFDEIDMDFYQNFPIKNSIQKVAEYLLREHRISGPIFSAMTSSIKTPPIVGIDDKDHYDAHVRAVVESSKHKAQISKRIQSLKLKLEQEKSEIFNKALFKFDQTAQSYREGEISLGDYVSQLRHPGMSLSRIQQLDPGFRQGDDFMGTIELFLGALHLERTLNFAQVEHERAILIRKLLQKFNEKQAQELLYMSTAFQSENLNHADFYEYLNKLLLRNKIQISKYKAMRDYIQYILLSNSIDGEKLHGELRQLEEENYTRLAETDEEKNLIAESRHLFLKGKLIDFALTKSEWDEYVGATRRVAQDPGAPGRGTASPLHMFERFYEEAEFRDTKMAQNLTRAIKKHNAKVTVLVTGGFHSRGIKDQLLRTGEGVKGRKGEFSHSPALPLSPSIIKFVPRISNLRQGSGGQAQYLSIFSQQKTPLDKLFAGEKLFLATRPHIPKWMAKKLTLLHSREGLTSTLQLGREHWKMVKENFRGKIETVSVDIVEQVQQRGLIVILSEIMWSKYFLLGSFMGALLTRFLLSSHEILPNIWAGLAMGSAAAMVGMVVSEEPSGFPRIIKIRADSEYEILLNREIPDEILNRPLSLDLGFSYFRYLRYAEIHTIRDYLSVENNVLNRITDVGPTVIDRLDYAMAVVLDREVNGAQEPSVRDSEILSQPIMNLKLSAHSRRFAARHGLRTIGELDALSDNEILSAKRAGHAVLAEIRWKINNYLRVETYKKGTPSIKAESGPRSPQFTAEMRLFKIRPDSKFEIVIDQEIGKNSLSVLLSNLPIGIDITRKLENIGFSTIGDYLGQRAETLQSKGDISDHIIHTVDWQVARFLDHTMNGNVKVSGFDPKLLDDPLDRLNLSIRVSNIAKSRNKTTVGGFYRHSDQELLELRDMGITALSEIWWKINNYLRVEMFKKAQEKSNLNPKNIDDPISMLIDALGNRKKYAGYERDAAIAKEELERRGITAISDFLYMERADFARIVLPHSLKNRMLEMLITRNISVGALILGKSINKDTAFLEILLDAMGVQPQRVIPVRRRLNNEGIFSVSDFSLFSTRFLEDEFGFYIHSAKTGELAKRHQYGFSPENPFRTQWNDPAQYNPLVLDRSIDVLEFKSAEIDYLIEKKIFTLNNLLLGTNLQDLSPHAIVQLHRYLQNQQAKTDEEIISDPENNDWKKRRDRIERVFKEGDPAFVNDLHDLFSKVGESVRPYIWQAPEKYWRLLIEAEDDHEKYDHIIRLMFEPEYQPEMQESPAQGQGAIAFEAFSEDWERRRAIMKAAYLNKGPSFIHDFHELLKRAGFNPLVRSVVEWATDDRVMTKNIPEMWEKLAAGLPQELWEEDEAYWRSLIDASEEEQHIFGPVVDSMFKIEKFAKVLADQKDEGVDKSPHEIIDKKPLPPPSMSVPSYDPPLDTDSPYIHQDTLALAMPGQPLFKSTTRLARNKKLFKRGVPVEVNHIELQIGNLSGHFTEFIWNNVIHDWVSIVPDLKQYIVDPRTYRIPLLTVKGKDGSNLSSDAAARIREELEEIQKNWDLTPWLNPGAVMASADGGLYVVFEFSSEIKKLRDRFESISDWIGFEFDIPVELVVPIAQARENIEVTSQMANQLRQFNRKYNKLNIDPVRIGIRKFNENTVQVVEKRRFYHHGPREEWLVGEGADLALLEKVKIDFLTNPHKIRRVHVAPVLNFPTASMAAYPRYPKPIFIINGLNAAMDSEPGIRTARAAAKEKPKPLNYYTDGATVFDINMWERIIEGAVYSGPDKVNYFDPNILAIPEPEARPINDVDISLDLQVPQRRGRVQSHWSKTIQQGVHESERDALINEIKKYYWVPINRQITREYFIYQYYFEKILEIPFHEFDLIDFQEAVWRELDKELKNIVEQKLSRSFSAEFNRLANITIRAMVAERFGVPKGHLAEDIDTLLEMIRKQKGSIHDAYVVSLDDIRDELKIKWRKRDKPEEGAEPRPIPPATNHNVPMSSMDINGHAYQYLDRFLSPYALGLKDKISELLRTLSHRERKVISLRYGLSSNGVEYTLEEVGYIIKKNKERVRQIQNKAIRLLAQSNLVGFLGKGTLDSSLSKPREIKEIINLNEKPMPSGKLKKITDEQKEELLRWLDGELSGNQRMVWDHFIRGGTLTDAIAELKPKAGSVEDIWESIHAQLRLWFTTGMLADIGTPEQLLNWWRELAEETPLEKLAREERITGLIEISGGDIEGIKELILHSHPGAFTEKEVDELVKSRFGEILAKVERGQPRKLDSEAVRRAVRIHLEHIAVDEKKRRIQIYKRLIRDLYYPAFENDFKNGTTTGLDAVNTEINQLKPSDEEDLEIYTYVRDFYKQSMNYQLRGFEEYVNGDVQPLLLGQQVSVWQAVQSLENPSERSVIFSSEPRTAKTIVSVLAALNIKNPDGTYSVNNILYTTSKQAKYEVARELKLRLSNDVKVTILVLDGEKGDVKEQIKAASKKKGPVILISHYEATSAYAKDLKKFGKWNSRAHIIDEIHRLRRGDKTVRAPRIFGISAMVRIGLSARMVVIKPSDVAAALSWTRRKTYPTAAHARKLEPKEVYSALYPISVRWRRRTLMPNVKDPIYKNVFIKYSQRQDHVVHEMRNNFVDWKISHGREDIATDKDSFFARFERERRAGVDLSLVMDGNFTAQSTKVQFLLKKIEEEHKENGRVLVLLDFVEGIERVVDLIHEKYEGRIKAAGLDGHMSLNKRNELIDQFRGNENGPHVLIGTSFLLADSLNLFHKPDVSFHTKTVVRFTRPWWNDQAGERLVGMGQAHQVTVYDLVSEFLTQPHGEELTIEQIQLEDLAEKADYLQESVDGKPILDNKSKSKLQSIFERMMKGRAPPQKKQDGFVLFPLLISLTVIILNLVLFFLPQVLNINSFIFMSFFLAAFGVIIRFGKNSNSEPDENHPKIHASQAYLYMGDAFKRAGLDEAQGLMVRMAFQDWTVRPRSRKIMLDMLKIRNVNEEEANKVADQFNFDKPFGNELFDRIGFDYRNMNNTQIVVSMVGRLIEVEDLSPHQKANIDNMVREFFEGMRRDPSRYTIPPDGALAGLFLGEKRFLLLNPTIIGKLIKLAHDDPRFAPEIFDFLKSIFVKEETYYNAEYNNDKYDEVTSRFKKAREDDIPEGEQYEIAKELTAIHLDGELDGYDNSLQYLKSRGWTVDLVNELLQIGPPYFVNILKQNQVEFMFSFFQGDLPLEIRNQMRKTLVKFIARQKDTRRLFGVNTGLAWNMVVEEEIQQGRLERDSERRTIRMSSDAFRFLYPIFAWIILGLTSPAFAGEGQGGIHAGWWAGLLSTIALFLTVWAYRSKRIASYWIFALGSSTFVLYTLMFGAINEIQPSLVLLGAGGTLALLVLSIMVHEFGHFFIGKWIQWKSEVYKNVSIQFLSREVLYGAYTEYTPEYELNISPDQSVATFKGGPFANLGLAFLSFTSVFIIPNLLVQIILLANGFINILMFLMSYAVPFRPYTDGYWVKKFHFAKSLVQNFASSYGFTEILSISMQDNDEFFVRNPEGIFWVTPSDSSPSQTALIHYFPESDLKESGPILLSGSLRHSDNDLKVFHYQNRDYAVYEITNFPASLLPSGPTKSKNIRTNIFRIFPMLLMGILSGTIGFLMYQWMQSWEPVEWVKAGTGVGMAAMVLDKERLVNAIVNRFVALSKVKIFRHQDSMLSEIADFKLKKTIKNNVSLAMKMASPDKPVLSISFNHHLPDDFPMGHRATLNSEQFKKLISQVYDTVNSDLPDEELKASIVFLLSDPDVFFDLFGIDRQMKGEYGLVASNLVFQYVTETIVSLVEDILIENDRLDVMEEWDVFEALEEAQVNFLGDLVAPDGFIGTTNLILDQSKKSGRMGWVQDDLYRYQQFLLGHHAFLEEDGLSNIRWAFRNYMESDKSDKYIFPFRNRIFQTQPGFLGEPNVWRKNWVEIDSDVQGINPEKNTYKYLQFSLLQRRSQLLGRLNTLADIRNVIQWEKWNDQPEQYDWLQIKLSPLYGEAVLNMMKAQKGDHILIVDDEPTLLPLYLALMGFNVTFVDLTKKFKKNFSNEHQYLKALIRKNGGKLEIKHKKIDPSTAHHIWIDGFDAVFGNRQQFLIEDTGENKIYEFMEKIDSENLKSLFFGDRVEHMDRLRRVLKGRLQSVGLGDFKGVRFSKELRWRLRDHFDFNVLGKNSDGYFYSRPVKSTPPARFKKEGMGTFEIIMAVSLISVLIYFLLPYLDWVGSVLILLGSVESEKFNRIRDLVKKHLSHLSFMEPVHASVLRGKYILNKKHKEIASAMGLGESKIAARHATAVKRLQMWDEISDPQTKERVEKFKSQIPQLSERRNKIITLFFLKNQDLESIAHEMDIKTPDIEQILWTAIQKLYEIADPEIAQKKQEEVELNLIHAQIAEELSFRIANGKGISRVVLMSEGPEAQALQKEIEGTKFDIVAFREQFESDGISIAEEGDDPDEEYERAVLVARLESISQRLDPNDRAFELKGFLSSFEFLSEEEIMWTIDRLHFRESRHKGIYHYAFYNPLVNIKRSKEEGFAQWDLVMVMGILFALASLVITLDIKMGGTLFMALGTAMGVYIATPQRMNRFSNKINTTNYPHGDNTIEVFQYQFEADEKNKFLAGKKDPIFMVVRVWGPYQSKTNHLLGGFVFYPVVEGYELIYFPDRNKDKIKDWEAALGQIQSELKAQFGPVRELSLHHKGRFHNLRTAEAYAAHVFLVMERQKDPLNKIGNFNAVIRHVNLLRGPPGQPISPSRVLSRLEALDFKSEHFNPRNISYMHAIWQRYLKAGVGDLRQLYLENLKIYRNSSFVAALMLFKYITSPEIQNRIVSIQSFDSLRNLLGSLGVYPFHTSMSHGRSLLVREKLKKIGIHLESAIYRGTSPDTILEHVNNSSSRAPKFGLRTIQRLFSEIKKAFPQIKKRSQQLNKAERRHHRRMGRFVRRVVALEQQGQYYLKYLTPDEEKSLRENFLRGPEHADRLKRKRAPWRREPLAEIALTKLEKIVAPGSDYRLFEENKHRLNDELDPINPIFARVLHLAFSEKKSVRKIASILGYSHGSIHNWKRDALAQLRKSIPADRKGTISVALMAAILLSGSVFIFPLSLGGVNPQILILNSIVIGFPVLAIILASIIYDQTHHLPTNHPARKFFAAIVVALVGLGGSVLYSTVLYQYVPKYFPMMTARGEEYVVGGAIVLGPVVSMLGWYLFKLGVKLKKLLGIYVASFMALGLGMIGMRTVYGSHDLPEQILATMLIYHMSLLVLTGFGWLLSKIKISVILGLGLIGLGWVSLSPETISKVSMVLGISVVAMAGRLTPQWMREKKLIENNPEAMEELKPQDSQFLNDFFIKNLLIEKMAEKYGITIIAVRNRKARLIKQLKKLIQAERPPPTLYRNEKAIEGELVLRLSRGWPIKPYTLLYGQHPDQDLFNAISYFDFDVNAFYTDWSRGGSTKVDKSHLAPQKKSVTLKRLYKQLNIIRETPPKERQLIEFSTLYERFNHHISEEELRHELHLHGFSPKPSNPEFFQYIPRVKIQKLSRDLENQVMNQFEKSKFDQFADALEVIIQNKDEYFEKIGSSEQWAAQLQNHAYLGRYGIEGHVLQLFLHEIRQKGFYFQIDVDPSREGWELDLFYLVSMLTLFIDQGNANENMVRLQRILDQFNEWSHPRNVFAERAGTLFIFPQSVKGSSHHFNWMRSLEDELNENYWVDLAVAQTHHLSNSSRGNEFEPLLFYLTIILKGFIHEEGSAQKREQVKTALVKGLRVAPDVLTDRNKLSNLIRDQKAVDRYFSLLSHFRVKSNITPVIRPSLTDTPWDILKRIKSHTNFSAFSFESIYFKLGLILLMAVVWGANGLMDTSHVSMIFSLSAVSAIFSWKFINQLFKSKPIRNDRRDFLRKVSAAYGLHSTLGWVQLLASPQKTGVPKEVKTSMAQLGESMKNYLDGFNNPALREEVVNEIIGVKNGSPRSLEAQQLAAIWKGWENQFNLAVQNGDLELISRIIDRAPTANVERPQELIHRYNDKWDMKFDSLAVGEKFDFFLDDLDLHLQNQSRDFSELYLKIENGISNDLARQALQMQVRSFDRIPGEENVMDVLLALAFFVLDHNGNGVSEYQLDRFEDLVHRWGDWIHAQPNSNWMVLSQKMGIPVAAILPLQAPDKWDHLMGYLTVPVLMKLALSVGFHNKTEVEFNRMVFNIFNLPGKYRDRTIQVYMMAMGPHLGPNIYPTEATDFKMTLRMLEYGLEKIREESEQTLPWQLAIGTLLMGLVLSNENKELIEEDVKPALWDLDLKIEMKEEWVPQRQRFHRLLMEYKPEITEAVHATQNEVNGIEHRSWLVQRWNLSLNFFQRLLPWNGGKKLEDLMVGPQEYKDPFFKYIENLRILKNPESFPNKWPELTDWNQFLVWRQPAYIDESFRFIEEKMESLPSLFDTAADASDNLQPETSPRRSVRRDGFNSYELMAGIIVMGMLLLIGINAVNFAMDVRRQLDNMAIEEMVLYPVLTMSAIVAWGVSLISFVVYSWNHIRHHKLSLRWFIISIFWSTVTASVFGTQYIIMAVEVVTLIFMLNLMARKVFQQKIKSKTNAMAKARGPIISTLVLYFIGLIQSAYIYYQTNRLIQAGQLHSAQTVATSAWSELTRRSAIRMVSKESMHVAIKIARETGDIRGARDYVLMYVQDPEYGDRAFKEIEKIRQEIRQKNNRGGFNSLEIMAAILIIGIVVSLSPAILVQLITGLGLGGVAIATFLYWQKWSQLNSLKIRYPSTSEAKNPVLYEKVMATLSSTPVHLGVDGNKVDVVVKMDESAERFRVEIGQMRLEFENNEEGIEELHHYLTTNKIGIKRFRSYIQSPLIETFNNSAIDYYLDGMRTKGISVYEYVLFGFIPIPRFLYEKVPSIRERLEQFQRQLVTLRHA